MRRQITVSAKAPRTHLVDHISVLRALPNRQLGTVGPYVFFDHLERLRLTPEARLYVKPHPHAGLQVVTYVFSGAVVHRDSLGNRSVASLGDMHWLIAGRGIVHSEDSDFGMPEVPYDLELLQIWCSIPQPLKGLPPDFVHHAAAILPVIEIGNAQIRVVAGACNGATSPARSCSPLIFLDIDCAAGGAIEIPVEPSFELGLYVVAGEASVAEHVLTKGQFGRFDEGGDVVALTAMPGLRAVLVGGQPLCENTVIHSGFVLNSMDEVRRARRDYEEGRFGVIA